jgi:hypothetical protein
MKKLALVHKRWFAPSAVTDRWRLLFEGIRDECGFEIAFIEDTKRIPADAEVVLFSCGAKHLEDKRILDLALDYRGKRIVYLADYEPTQHGGATAVLARADLILAPEEETYRRTFTGKHIEFFPYFFAPQERYVTLPWNDTPRMRCLISGPVNVQYPLRLAAVKSPLVDTLPHTGSHGAEKAGAVVRDAYAHMLNAYYCAVGGSLRAGITTKTFEIMAAGSLLITDAVPDMGTLGIWAWEHYIPANLGDVADKIVHVLKEPALSDVVRRAGMQYARERHGISNRIWQFRSFIETF